MKTLATLSLILLLSASYMAMVEDDKASKRAARRKAAEAAPAGKAPSDVAVPVKTGLRLPSLFGDHPILQQNMKNTIWGWANPKEQITVAASWGASASRKPVPTADGRSCWIHPRLARGIR